MKRSPTAFWICFAALIVAAYSAQALRAATLESEATARRWVERLAATMEEKASDADVDKLTELYTDDVVYEHPHARAVVAGKGKVRAGIASHLGETRRPKIEIVRILAGADFAVVEINVSLDVRNGSEWMPLKRRQVVVLEMKDSRIQRMIDHWDR